MTAVTQQIPNFLGGVSRQTDDKKLINQLTECVNGYPDPTFGLLKRPGMKHTNVLMRADGTAFTANDLEDASWFFIDRAAAGSFIGAIQGTDLFVWTAGEGTFCTVTNNGTGYLTGTAPDHYHFRSIQDTTIITNNQVTVAMQADNTFVANSQATVKLKTLTNGDICTINITGTQQGETEPTTQTATATAQAAATFTTFLTGTHDTNDLLGAIENLLETRQNANDDEFNGRWYLNSFANSITIRRTTEANGIRTNEEPGDNVTYRAFTITGQGGPNNNTIEVSQDSVGNVAELPLESFHGHTITILNSAAAEDDYYVEFVADDGEGGKGSWRETRARNVSPGLDNATMPHELVNTGATTFTFGPIDYEPRRTGDDTTNPQPSFVGENITCSFFYSNRFGFLSEDNVIFGVANDRDNFFARSALTQIASDPIDLNVSSVRPVTLSDVLPSPQGLLLFSERQQFQVYATDASTLTPNSAVIRTLSNYEMATNVEPVDIGTTAAFVSRVPGYSKLFTMSLRDVEQTPIVVDISKAVLEWIPNGVDGITVSPPNSLVMLVDRDTSYLYVYRFYNNGKEDLFQAWVKWELPGTIQAARIINDSAIIISQQEDQYTIGSIELDELPSGNVIATTDDFTGNVPLDMATRPVSPTGIPSTLGSIVGGTGYADSTDVATTGGTGTGLTVDITTTDGVITAVSIDTAGTGYTTGDVVTISGGGGNATVSVASLTVAEVVYDEDNDMTKIYVPYTPIDDKDAVMLLTVPTADDGTDDELDSDQGYWAKAVERIEPGTNFRYFEVKGDFTDYADGIVVGYGYDLEAVLPKFYLRTQQGPDFTASLIVSRVKLSAGRTGAIRFKIKPTGSNEWRDVQHTAEGDIYSGDTNPVVQDRLFTLPIHQRNTNFELKVTSDFPYPVSLVSMMWEGNYSNKYYRRS
jgi:hypothetical protein